MSYVRMIQSGLTIDLASPKPESIDIHDIAFGLSRINRWAGQTYHPYSVARHSLDVYERVRERGDLWSACVALFALLHDAEEAYTGDVIAPVRQLIPEAAAIGTKIQLAIHRKLIPMKAYTTSYWNRDAEAIVHGADLFQRQMEDMVLRGVGFEYPDRKRGVSYSEPEADRQEFLDTYERLCTEIERLA